MAGITRRATVADARPIGALQLRAWHRNYEDIVAPAHMQEWDEEARAARWIQILTADLTETFVAEVAGAVRGFAAVGASREPAGADTGELYALYVDPPAQGAGVGTVLLAEAERALRAAGHTGAVLRVFAENGLARRFYEGRGWTLVPGRETRHRWDADAVLYRRAL